MKTGLFVTSASFRDFEEIPKKHTRFGADISPPFRLANLRPEVVSVAIVMDDLDLPLIKPFSHWLVWNLPPMAEIPENLPHGSPVPSFETAQQGRAYGRNRYRGPNPPFFFRKPHRYVFRFYGLDTLLDLDSRARRKQVLAAMEGHVLQEGSLTGRFKRN